MQSLAAGRRHDQLALRLHAADSIRALVRLLFGLEGRLPPPADHLVEALEEVEVSQAWPAGYLRWVLPHLLRDPAPRRQLELARRVERLLASRGLPSQAIVEPERSASRGLAAGSWHRDDARHLRAGPDARSVLE